MTMSSSINNNNNDIVPEMPQMRSVLIRSSVEPAMPGRNSFGVSAKTAPWIQNPSTKIAVVGVRSSWKPVNVPKLPELYPLERSHVSIPDADAVEIAMRIADCLRKESIAATFEENKAVAETSCHTQFYVKLFEDEHQLVVEVQRRTGCSYVFHQCSKAVLRAAKGQESRRDTPQFTIPDSIRKSEQLDKVNAYEEALEHSFDLLKKERVDAQLLGMQSLIKLSEQAPLGDRVTVIINHVHERPADDDEFGTMLRRDALTVLANSLVENQPPELLSDELLRVLIADLTDSDLHTAHQAARCLTAICQCRPLKQLLTKMGASPATEMAKEEGLLRHKLLEREAQLLQLELEG